MKIDRIKVKVVVKKNVRKVFVSFSYRELREEHIKNAKKALRENLFLSVLVKEKQASNTSKESYPVSVLRPFKAIYFT